MKQGFAAGRPQVPPLRMRTLASVVLATLIGPLALPAAHAGQLQQLHQLQGEIDALNARLQQLVAQQAQEQQHQQALEQAQQRVQASVAAAAATGPALTPTRAEAMSGQAQYLRKGAMPGSFIVPGSQTSVHVGGFVNFQGIYDPTENLGPKFAIGNLTPPGSVSRAQSQRTFHAQDKVSRLIVTTSTPSSYGDIGTNISLDFYGYTPGGDNGQALQNNNWGARIVYAYGTLGNWLFGQANSNFIDDADQAETFDNAGPAGVPGGHTPQVRYTFHFRRGAQLGLALENPQTGYQDTQDNIEVATKTNPFPDLTANFQKSGDWGHFQLSGLVRELGFTDMNGVRTTKWAGGGIVGATLNLPDGHGGYGRDNGGFQAWFGAVGRYLPDDFGANVASVLAVNDGTAANPTGAAAVDVQNDTGLTLYAQHWWSSKLRSNIGLGVNHQSLAAFLPADSQNAVKTETVHVNLIEQPVPSVDLGVEYMWGRKTFQSSTGLAPANASRLEFGGIWHF
ncbi:DcaP family trimeric outer membrane transporter [Thiomonas sp. FB-6]|uniref:DcaP family trimeric outer membrane transporter n=1 Tax=Thiomonas sp. FB-6 TaxID=1158291 RepID=UPI00037C0879|nr:DcaP family trimeric outer membrane transporter [Thiomonas sp. FB-6]